MAEIIGAHLVGSAPVTEPEQIFRLAVDHLGARLRRIGDGEVGERDTWIRWQYPKMALCPQLEPAAPDDAYRRLEQFKLVEGAGPIELVDLGYADAAIESYQAFSRLKTEGAVPKDLRFMVGLPTPLSVVTMYVAPGSRNALLAAYTSSMLNQLERILGAIPHGELAIQWEVCIEFGILEGLWTLLDGDAKGEQAKEGIAEHVIALGQAVPTDVELGYHLCYGDSGHEHFTQPTDAGFLAWTANALVGGVGRPINWIHMPVPKERDDVAYFKPLAGLELPTETELYLGLVHQTDGLEGTKRRVAAAEQVVARFGVATECGLGRRQIDTIPSLLDQHAAISAVHSGSD